MRRILLASAALTLAACQHVGTKVTVDSQRGTTVRAVDQQILSDAIDAGFAGLSMPRLKRALPVVAPYTAYVVVASVMPIGNDLREYVGTQAAAAASAAGLAVREVQVIRERIGPVEREFPQYPDTDARVLVLVSYAGVDQLEAAGSARSTDRSQRAVVGRFKATISIVGRNADVPAWSTTLTGEKKLHLDEVRYWEAKGGWSPF